MGRNCIASAATSSHNSATLSLHWITSASSKPRSFWPCIPPAEPPGELGMTANQSYLRQVRAITWIIALLAGFLQTWSARFALTPDSTHYLDIASAYLRSDWHGA